MTDYSKSTVAALRQLLKDRSIPSTGLTRKAQIIEKLEEHDEKSDDIAGESEATPAVDEPEATENAQDIQDPVVLTGQRILQSANGAQEVKSNIEEPVPIETSRPGPTPEPAPAKPSETEPQTQTKDVDMTIKTPSPDPNEKLSVEKPEVPTVPEGSVDTTTELSRLNTEELEADTRKRKRRSGSPELAVQDIRAKKPRPRQDAAPEVHLKEDTDVVMEQRKPEVEPETEMAADDHKYETTNSNGEVKTEMKDTSIESKPNPIERKERAPRYKELLEPSAPIALTGTPLDDDERPIVPALHLATPAIYIRNFMRPLRPEPLRAHLVSLATPPTADPDPTILKTLFLDSMKTHAFVLFSDTKAASRVRASLHGSIWPAEVNRKDLWVDFVPEESVESWITAEEDATLAEKAARATGAPIPTKRFEVVYPETENEVTAVFQEVGAGGSGVSSAPLNAPRGPKSNVEQRRNVAPPNPQTFPPTTDASTKADIGQSFQTLDSLFESTTAKPKLYFLPVSDDRSAARLDDLDKETSRDWRPEDRVRGRGRGRLDQKVKISFDSDDRVVETGPDHGPWADDSGGFRGGRGGSRGGGGGYRGDGYRGGGGGGGWFRGGRGWRG